MASLVLMNAGKVEIGLGVRSSALWVSPQGILQYIKNLVHCLVKMPKNTFCYLITRIMKHVHPIIQLKAFRGLCYLL